MKERLEGTFWCTCERCEVMQSQKAKIERTLRTSKSRIYSWFQSSQHENAL